MSESMSDALNKTSILTEEEVIKELDRYDLAEMLLEEIIEWLNKLGDKRIGFWNLLQLITNILAIIKWHKKQEHNTL